MRRFIIQFSFIFSLFFSFFGIFSNSPEQLLVNAVESGDYQACVELIQSGADYNYHGTFDQNDFSSTDWSILMKAIARLGSLIIEAQSFINTADSAIKDIAYPVIGLGGVASLYTKSSIPFVASAFSAYFGWDFGMFRTKQFFHKKIDEQYKIVQLLLAQPNLEKNYQTLHGENAKLLVQMIIELFYSHYLSPPFTSRKPEESYNMILCEIKSSLSEPLLTDDPAGCTFQRVFASGDIQPDEYLKRFEFSHDHFVKTGTTYKKFIDSLPIVFDPGYNITFFGLENLHPFDTKKYGKIAQHIKKELTDYKFFDPQIVSQKDLDLIHTKKYLELIKKPSQVGFVADMPILCLLPYRLTESLLMKPVMKAVGGTLQAVEIAKEYGISFNLSGGYHHAKTNDPVYGGFCLINDVCIAAKKLLQEHPNWKILIIDLDAHQGNGNAEVVKYEKNIAIFDIYNGDTWPGDFQTQERINFPILLKAKTRTEEYLKLLKTYLPRVIDTVKPDFVIYNAGTDIYEKDPLGCLSVSAEGIIARDEFVFEQMISRNIPITMLLSGGYHKDSAEIIGRSVVNVLKKFFLM